MCMRARGHESTKEMTSPIDALESSSTTSLEGDYPDRSRVIDARSTARIKDGSLQLAAEVSGNRGIAVNASGW